MNKFQILKPVIIIFCLLSLNFLPFIGPSAFGEYGAPDGSGITKVTWYIEASDDVTYENRTFWTKEIMLNSTSRMTWKNVTAYINGDITVRSNSYFNLTDCFLNLSGNLSIGGIVNFDNVTILMNSTFDGEFGINVTTSGTFNVLNKSNITAFDKSTGIDLDSTLPGNETWGLHYNFTVHGKLSIDRSYVSYTYGNLYYLGGIHLYSTSDASITNSEIFENEITAIYAEGDTEHQILNNHIYNSTLFGVYLYDYANATIYNNTIETYLANYGIGIVCEDHCAPKIYKNIIRNNRYDGIFLVDYSNATIWNNTISNNHRVGIFLNGRVLRVIPNPPSVDATICNPLIQENLIIDNYEFGIYDRCCHAQIKNNTIINTKNQSGIYIISYQTFSIYIVHFSCEGNITNNTIDKNNNDGLQMVSTWQKPWIITMNVTNNSIINNNWSGVAVIGGYDNTNTQRSPLPDIAFNDISNNSEHGILTLFALDFMIRENTVTNNSLSGLAFRNSSKPKVFNNNISWNFEHGIDSSGSSTPNVHDNNIFENNHSGIYGQGGNSNFLITDNNIFGNYWSGIELNNSVCRVQGNDINNNTQNGLKISRGTPTINNNNLVFYNHWNGLACYQNTQPMVADNQFRFNDRNGIYLNGANPRAGNNDNLISDNIKNGLYIENGAGGEVKAQIINNGQSGVFSTGTGTSTNIIDSNISSNGEHGVNATGNSSPLIVNSTIGNDNGGYAFWLTGSADPVALNTTFNTVDTYYYDSASILSVKWFVHINTVAKSDGSAVGGCRVFINSTAQPGANPIWTGVSNPNGRLRWLRIVDYTESKSGKVSYSPMDITGDAYYYRTTHVTPNPIIDHSQTITIELLPNNRPNLVSNIRPIMTHNPHPTINWDPATDPDSQSVGYRVWIGSIENTSNIFFYNSPLLQDTSITIPQGTLTHDDNDGNKTYHLTIVANDRHGGESFTFERIYLLNHKPSQPEITLNIPEFPTILLTSVTCEITGLSSDPDGDQINYTFKWYRNGQEQTGLREPKTTSLSDTISVFTDDISFNKGDVWEVRVNADDGLGFGAGPAQTASFSIGNVGPEIDQVIEDLELEEDQRKMGYFDLDKAFKDIDETGELKFKITVSDKNLTVKRDTETNMVDIMPGEDWNGKATINFTCIDDEGLWATQIIMVTVTPVNDKPEFKTIGGVPWRPGITISFADDDAAIEEQWFNFTVTGSDIDVERGEDDELTFQVSEPNKVIVKHLDSEPLMASLSFFPTDEDVGVFTFTISVKDKYFKNYLYETTIEISVLNTNDKPKIISIKKYSSDTVFEFPEDNILDLRDEITVKQGDTLTLIITATDPDVDHDDDLLTFHSDAIDFIEVDSNTGDDYTAKIILRPGRDDVGLLVFNITVKDLILESDSVQIKLFIDNINDRPRCWIISPSLPDKIFEQDDMIILEGEAEDYDLRYGDELSYKWVSDKDGELGLAKAITVSNLTIGRHLITFTVRDKEGESASNITTLIIRESEAPPPEDKPKDGDDDLDLLFIVSLIVMIIVIIIMLLILFIALRKHKKGEKIFGKGDEEKSTGELKRPGEEEDTLKPGEIKPSGEAGVVKSPTQYVPPSQGIPQTMPETPTTDGQQTGQPTSYQQQTPQMPAGTTPFLPPQMTTCPKCNSIMTFGPEGKLFCMICGYKPET